MKIHGRSEEAFGGEEIEPGHKSKIPNCYMDFATDLTATVVQGEDAIDFLLNPRGLLHGVRKTTHFYKLTNDQTVLEGNCDVSNKFEFEF